MTAPMTGRRDPAQPGAIVLDRRFDAPATQVWAAVTESARLERWIGRWSGDPAEGRVLFTMTAEGDDVPAEEYAVEECSPPSRLVVRAPGPDGEPWVLTLWLTEDAEGTTLHFAQQLSDAETAASVGPGWEYYLDRLVAAETGGDVGAVDFGDYYPALAADYRALVG